MVTDAIARLTQALADRYLIERELGQGGMATVYLAQDVKHDRKVALKVLRPELAAVIGGDRFLQEIKTTANLQHPHILPLHDSGEAGGAVYYVMPYVEGESLRDRIDRDKQLPVDEAVRIAREVADALDYAHRHGVIHRDIKPDNILLHDGHVLVADFGIALAASRSEGGTRMTETGMSLGTPHYMSPEQAMGEREIRASSDVYALACVLYEMLMGEPPFTGPTAQAIVAKVMTDHPHPMSVHRRSIPAHVENAVMVGLEKLPADRFASAAEFAAALGGATTTRMAAAGMPATRRGPWRPLAIGALLVAAGALTVATWAWRRAPADEPGVMRVSLTFPPGERIRSTSTRRFALAPDGSRIVYVGQDSAGTQLWVREMNSLTARPLPGTNGADAPFFSRDGQSVGFFTGNPGDLRIVPVAGGVSRTVVRDSAAPWGGDWADDGMIYFVGPDARVARVPAGGGAVEHLGAPDTTQGSVEYDWPQYLPGGKRLLIQIWHTSVGDAELGVLDLATGEVAPLFQAAYGRYLPNGYLVYTTVSGTLMAVPFDGAKAKVVGAPRAIADLVQVDPFSGSGQFAVSDNGVLAYMAGGGPGSQQVVWVDRAGTQIPVDTSWVGQFGTLALSPDGRQLAITQISAEGEQVWVKQLPRGPLSRLTYGGAANVRPVWTRDGRRIAFVSSRRGNLRQTYIQRADGSADADSLMADPRQVDQVAFTPDGQGFLYRTGSSGTNSRDIHAARLGGGESRTMVAGPADEFGPVISPSGRWFAYVSNQAGRDEVFVRSFADPAAGRTQVSVDGGNEPLWAHNGRELFFRSRRGEMMSVDVTTGDTFTAGQPRVLFEATNMATDPYHHAYDVSADDRRFLMVNRAINDVAELVVVVNWFKELERRR